jgi:hypothetical protein
MRRIRMKSRELEALRARYDEDRAVLDDLTREQAQFGARIEAAVRAGDSDTLRALRARRKELPALVEAASVAVDRAGLARDEAELARLVEQVGPAEAEFTRLSEELAAKRAEFEEAERAYRAIRSERRTLEMNLADRRRREARRAATAA